MHATFGGGAAKLALASPLGAPIIILVGRNAHVHKARSSRTHSSMGPGKQ